MKKILLLIVFFSSYVFANGCGSRSNVADFSQTAKAGGNPSLQNSFTGFGCPAVPGKQPETIILSNINFSTGEYQCEYAFEQSITDQEKAELAKEGDVKGQYIEDQNQGINYTNTFCREDEKAFKTNFGKYGIGIVPTGEIKNFSGATDKAKYVGLFPVTGLNNGIFFGTNTVNKLDLNFKEIRNRISTLKKAESTASSMAVEKRQIKTNANNKANGTFSIAEYFAGIITLNPDVFDETKPLLDSFGKVSLKGKPISFIQNPNISWLPDATPFNTANIEIIDPLEAIIDGKFWGFYIAFIENIRLAEHSIVLMLFGVGFTALVGQKGISSFYSSFGDNQQERVSNLGISKMIVSPVLALVFFTAPIVPSNLKIPDQFIKENSSPPNGIILNGGANGGTASSVLDEVGNSTIIQTAIRHFVTWGTLSANELADYALYPYLNYLELRQGAVFGSLAKTYEDQLISASYNFKTLEKAVHFYEGFCKPTYKSDDEEAAVLLSSPMLGKQRTLLREITQESYDKVNFKGKFGFDTVSAELCANLEYQIGQLTQKAFSEYAMLDGATASSVKFVEHIIKTGSKVKNKHEYYFQPTDELASSRIIAGRMIAMQEASGWVFSALAPLGYIITQSVSVAETIEEKQEIAKKFSVSSGFRQNQINSNNVVENKGDEDLGIKQQLARMMIFNTNYFMLPKFTELFKIIVSIIETSASIVALIISEAVSIATLVGFPLNFILGGVTGVLSWIAIKVASSIIGYFLAIILYNYFLKITVLTAVMCMALYKIAMYYIEVLVFFVMSPAVVIWAVVSKKSEVIWHYIGKGAVLTVMPIIIVLSCYLFIFSSETLATIYSYLSGLVSGIFVTGKTSFMTSVTVYSVISMGNAICLGANLFIGYITIIKASQWFLETVGAKASVMDSFAGEMGQRAEKYIGVV